MERGRSRMARFFIVFTRSSPDICWKCYKKTSNNRTKKEKVKIYENLSVIKVSIELITNGEKQGLN